MASTFSYSGSPGDSDLDEVRFYLQDTNSADPLISDEEIAFLLGIWFPVYNSNVYVASIAAENIASKFAREVSYSADGVSVSGDQLQQKYQTLAIALREMYRVSRPGGVPNVGGIILDEYFDESIGPLNFSVGMNDNRDAGQQQYGGTPVVEAVPEIEGYPW